MVGSKEGGSGRQGVARTRCTGVGESTQTWPGPAPCLLIESIDSSYKRTDNWLPKSL